MCEDCFSWREEGGVDRAQAVLVTLLRHGAERTPATIASVKLLGIVLAVQVALGITLVALVATDNLPFTGDDEADGQHAARRPPSTWTASTARPRSAAAPPGRARPAAGGLAGVAPARARC